MNKVLCKMSTNVTLINTIKDLEEAYLIWKKLDILGIDIECENNLHHYGASISIIQISSKTQNWIVDVMTLGKISQVISIFENPNIIKIFHGSDFDFRMLYSEFNCNVKNIFDTQIASQLIGLSEIGLGAILEKFLNVSKEEKFQMADWTKRPMTPEMLEYATKDSKYLITLRNILIKKLEEKNRIDWMTQECKYLEETTLKMHEPCFWDLKGLSKITDTQRAVLKEVYNLREELAKKVNRPVHFVINSRKLNEIALNPPRFDELKKIKGVHPVVRQFAPKFDIAIKKGLLKKLKMKNIETKRFTKEQRDKVNHLNEIRTIIAEKLIIEPHLIMNKDQMYEIALSNSLNCLRAWQLELVKPKINF